MSALDWEEVKRLAADFQRAQLTSGAQRLSERNCIEIITRLIEEKLLDVIFTTDGKEYITPSHLIKEIKDELIVSGGRINLVEVSKNLSVDLQVITKRSSEIESSGSSVRIINGELISNSYIATLCNDINDQLQRQGQISISDLTSQVDLSSEFLLGIIEKQLGKQIHGIQDKQDRQIFFTRSFIERNAAIVRGALNAIVRPVTINALISLCGIPERLFYAAIDILAERKEIPGVITGKQRMAGSYVPHIYTKTQTEWVNNFLNQNGYLEYAALNRLGISDAQGFIQKSLSKANLIPLCSVAVGTAIINQIEASIDEAISSATFVKLMQILPTVFEPADAELLMQKILQRKGSPQGLHIFNSTALVTDQYVRVILKECNSIVESSAKDYVASGEYVKNIIERNQQNRGVIDEKGDAKADRKEERRKKAAEGKGGGGTQGRETKTKSTKKKYLKGKQQQQQDDSDEDNEGQSKSSQKELVGRKAIVNSLSNLELLQDEDDDGLQSDLVEYLHPLLNRKALEQANVIFESTIASSNQNRRKKHAELQEKLTNLILNVRLFDKGIKLFENVDVNQQLTKYLLKTICTDIVNEVFLYVAHEHTKLFEDSTELTTEQRAKVLNEIPADMREPLLKLHKSLNGQSVDEYLSVAEVALGPGVSDIVIVKHDKKKERPQMLQIRQQLIEQLNMADDPALVLHLAALIIFQGCTQNVLHASGKFVAHIITMLKPLLDADVHDTLKTYHDLVLQFLSSPENRSNVGSALEEEMPRIKELAIASKKGAGNNKERLSSITSN